VAQAPPASWVEAVDAAVAAHRPAWDTLRRAEDGRDTSTVRLQRVVEAAGADVLLRLYPSAAEVLSPS
jgi:hypothetical protein